MSLANVLRDTGEPFDPILVFRVNERLYVVDGHHRLFAYHTAGWKNRVPVEEFKGSLREAREEAMRRNIKDKLPMTKQDKMEAAWSIVKLGNVEDGGYSIRQTVELTTVSTSTVDNMRSVFAKLKETLSNEQELATLSWKRARDAANGSREDKDADEWREQEIEKLVKAFKRGGFGNAFVKYPDMVAEAIARLDERLPGILAGEWFTPEDLQEMAGDTEEVEF